MTTYADLFTGGGGATIGAMAADIPGVDAPALLDDLSAVLNRHVAHDGTATQTEENATDPPPEE